jgi:hypothetical protein
MRKSKSAYLNYVCPHCWKTLNKCVCELFPPYNLILIDSNIQEHICILNEKGYRTTGCCEGHSKVCISTYISFARDYFDVADIPEGFKYNKKRKMIDYTYSTRLSKEDMENMKKEKLKTLLEWVKGLPDIKSDNKNMF